MELRHRIQNCARACPCALEEPFLNKHSTKNKIAILFIVKYALARELRTRLKAAAQSSIRSAGANTKIP